MGERLEGERCNELGGRVGHGDMHTCVELIETTGKGGGFVGGDAARDAEDDGFVGKEVHGVVGGGRRARATFPRVRVRSSEWFAFPGRAAQFRYFPACRQ